MRVCRPSITLGRMPEGAVYRFIVPYQGWEGSGSRPLLRLGSCVSAISHYKSNRDRVNMEKPFGRSFDSLACGRRVRGELTFLLSSVARHGLLIPAWRIRRHM